MPAMRGVIQECLQPGASVGDVKLSRGIKPSYLCSLKEPNKESGTDFKKKHHTDGHLISCTVKKITA